MYEDVKPEDAKPRRRYDSRRRQAQAAQTRHEILGAAHRLFLERGYAGTTLASVAEGAGVVVETIYRAFGGKAGLFQAVIAEADPRRQLELYAATQPGIHARIGPLFRVLAEAAAADPELAEVSRQMDEQRLAGMGRFAQLLADRGALRPGLSVDEARDVLWTLNSHAVHDLLVVRRGWPPGRYRDWLSATLARTLLPDDGPSPS